LADSIGWARSKVDQPEDALTILVAYFNFGTGLVFSALTLSPRALEDRAHLYRRPCATARCRNTPRCQRPRNPAERLDAAGLDFPDHR
jgi:hypothetical protein